MKIKKYVNLTAKVLIILLTTTIFSCKKDHKVSDQLTTIKRTTNGDLTTFSISYNDNGKISAMYGAGNYAENAVFSYKENTTLIYRNVATTNVFRSIDSLTLNPSGYVINLRSFLNQRKSEWSNWKYELNSANQLQRFIKTSSGGSSVIEGLYTYTDGNLIQSEGTKYIYDTSKPAKLGDYHSMNQLLTYGQDNMLSKNLVIASVNGSDTTHFTYEYNGEGNISTLTIINKGVTAAEFKYDYVPLYSNL